MANREPHALRARNPSRLSLQSGGLFAGPSLFRRYLVNNLGDPYVGSHYGSQTCDLEREAVAWLMDLWQCDDHDEFIARTERLVASLRAADVPVLCNPYSFTVVFPQPGEAIVRTYQLACNKGEAHAIVMPNVTDALISRFVSDYLAWWKTSQRQGDPR